MMSQFKSECIYRDRGLAFESGTSLELPGYIIGREKTRTQDMELCDLGRNLSSPDYWLPYVKTLPNSV
jgi:hypothetical protein